MNYAEKTLQTALTEARAKLLACAAAGPDAVKELISGAASVTAAVDLRTGEALTARVSLAEGSPRVWYDTGTRCLHGTTWKYYGTLALSDQDAAGLVEDAVWHPDAASPGARGAA